MPEIRLIDANALLKRLQEQQKYGSITDSRGRAKAILELIHAPTIDAQPVKHGHWIIEKEKLMYGKYKQIWALRCSECRKDPIKHIGGGLSNWWFQTPEFCPVCGAKMDGDADEQ